MVAGGQDNTSLCLKGGQDNILLCLEGKLFVPLLQHLPPCTYGRVIPCSAQKREVEGYICRDRLSCVNLNQTLYC